MAIIPGIAIGEGYNWAKDKILGTEGNRRRAGPAHEPKFIELDKMDVTDPKSLELKLADLNRIKPMGYMDFNPMQQNAIGNVNAGVDSSYQSTLGNLARSGGLSAADRMGAGSEMAKQKAQGTANVMGKLNELQAQNRFDVNRFNTDQRNNLWLKNIELQNRQREFNTNNINDARRLQDKIDWDRMKTNKSLEANWEQANAMAR